jgi:hypothetical protein
MARLFILLAAICLVVGCGGDDKKKGSWNEECAINEDCAAPLICSAKICTKRCANGTDAECTDLNPSAKCLDNYCYLSCETNAGCPVGMNCGTFSGLTRVCRLNP